MSCCSVRDRNGPEVHICSNAARQDLFTVVTVHGKETVDFLVRRISSRKCRGGRPIAPNCTGQQAFRTHSINDAATCEDKSENPEILLPTAKDDQECTLNFKKRQSRKKSCGAEERWTVCIPKRRRKLIVSRISAKDCPSARTACLCCTVSALNQEMAQRQIVNARCLSA